MSTLNLFPRSMCFLLWRSFEDHSVMNEAHTSFAMLGNQVMRKEMRL